MLELVRTHKSYNIGPERIEFIAQVAALKEVSDAAALRWIIDEYRTNHPEIVEALLPTTQAAKKVA